jgi:hypothetical protein
MFSASSASVTGLFTLIGAIAGVGLTGIFALATALINRRWASRDSQETGQRQDARYVQEGRKEVYVAYVLNIAKIYQSLQDIAESAKGPTSKTATFRDMVAEGERIRAELILMASRPVLLAEENYRSAQQELIGSVFDGKGYYSILPAYRALLEAMRDDVQSLFFIHLLPCRYKR